MLRELKETLKPCEHVAVSVVVDPAQAVLALWRGGPLLAVLQHEAGGELVQQPGGGAHLYSTVQYSWCSLGAGLTAGGEAAEAADTRRMRREVRTCSIVRTCCAQNTGW